MLLARRAPHKAVCPNAWDVIGGHVEAGETIEEALIREAEEETGVVPVRFASSCTLQRPDPLTNGDVAFHVFVVTEWRGGEPALRGDEHTEMRWFTREDACALEPLALEAYHEMFRRLPELQEE